MEFYNRMKQKLAEEFDNDPPEFPEGNGSDDVESLKAEITELKHHINSNYQVYVRRLEKRKTRIRELEEHIQKIASENSILAKSVEETEQYKTKLTECRDQLEQLEGFQNQELGKVKHMLLSAETALEIERQKNSSCSKRVESVGILVQTDAIDDSRIQHFSSADEATQALINQSDQLKYELNCERDSHQQSKEKIENLTDELESTKRQLAAISSERDSIKTTLLEAEIACHESHETNADELSSLQMEIARLQGEKETLQVTLRVRDNDIKAKKEDFRKEKENYQTALKSIESKELKVSALEAEVSSLKDTLSERLMQMRASQIANDKLSIEIENFQATLKERERLAEEHEAKSAILSDQRDGLMQENLVLQKSVHELNVSIEAYCEEISSLKASLATQSDEIARYKNEIGALARDRERLQKDRDDLEKSIPNLIESSELVRSLVDKTNALEGDLEDKKQAIRHLQLRSNEMKKMLQKELKNETTPDLPAAPNNSNFSAAPTTAATNGLGFSTPPSPSPTLSSRSREKETPSPLSGNLVISDVSIKYLRNVIFKFLTSPEDEAKQMTKAVATLLNFTEEEERLLHEYLDWKTSWFGSKPKITHSV